MMSAYVSSKSAGPFGWENAGRRLLHYHTVLPTSQSSMHLNMHRNLAPRLRAPGQLQEPNGLASALRILDQNRLPPKRFVGIKRYNAGQVRDVSERLAQYNTQLKPAEAKGEFPPIAPPCQREAQRERPQKEVDEMCCRLSAPKLLEENWQTNRGKTMNKKELDAVVERLNKYDPKTHPADSRGVPARGRSYSDLRGPQKSLTKQESDQVFGRLAMFDPIKGPAESPRHKGAPQSGVRRIQNRQYNEGDIEQIVERLTDYNRKKWPAESSGTRVQWADGHHWNFKRSKTVA